MKTKPKSDLLIRIGHQDFSMIVFMGRVDVLKCTFGFKVISVLPDPLTFLAITMSVLLGPTPNPPLG